MLASLAATICSAVNGCADGATGAGATAGRGAGVAFAALPVSALPVSALPISLADLVVAALLGAAGGRSLLGAAVADGAGLFLGLTRRHAQYAADDADDTADGAAQHAADRPGGAVAVAGALFDALHQPLGLRRARHQQCRQHARVKLDRRSRHPWSPLANHSKFRPWPSDAPQHWPWTLPARHG
jgi:hypothetical protein